MKIIKQNRKGQYNVGEHYAFRDLNGRKQVGLFSRRSVKNSRSVVLLVRNASTGNFKSCRVPHEKVSLNPWDSVGDLTRTGVPRCVRFRAQSRCERKYTRIGGQRLIKGKRVVKTSKF